MSERGPHLSSSPKDPALELGSTACHLLAPLRRWRRGVLAARHAGEGAGWWHRSEGQGADHRRLRARPGRRAAGGRRAEGQGGRPGRPNGHDEEDEPNPMDMTRRSSTPAARVNLLVIPTPDRDAGGQIVCAPLPPDGSSVPDACLPRQRVAAGSSISSAPPSGAPSPTRHLQPQPPRRRGTSGTIPRREAVRHLLLAVGPYSS